MRSSNSGNSQNPGRCSLVELGKIVKAHGYKGAFVVATPCGSSSSLATLREVYVGRETDSVQRLTLIRSRWMPKGWLLESTELKSDTEVKGVIGMKIYTERAFLPELPERKYYVSDLVGSSVIEKESGKIVGTLVAVEFHPKRQSRGHDWWVVEIEGKKILVPAVSEYIDSVELASRRITLKKLSNLL